MESTFLTSTFNFAHSNQHITSFKLHLSNKVKAKLMEVIIDNHQHVQNGFTLYFVIKFHPINSIVEKAQNNTPFCLQYTADNQSIIFHMQVKKSLYIMEIRKNSDRAFLLGIIKSQGSSKGIRENGNIIQRTEHFVSEDQEFHAINFEWLDEERNKIQRVKSGTACKYKVCAIIRISFTKYCGSLKAM